MELFDFELKCIFLLRLLLSVFFIVLLLQRWWEIKFFLKLRFPVPLQMPRNFNVIIQPVIGFQIIIPLNT